MRANPDGRSYVLRDVPWFYVQRRRIIRRLSHDQYSDIREQNLALDLVARGLRNLERIT